MASTALCTLEGWCRAYAEWLVVQPGIPLKPEKLAKASVLAGKRLSSMELRAVEVSPAFVALQKNLVVSQTEQAKSILLDSAVQFSRDFVAMANLAKDEKDYDKWIKYGLPVLERVWAKKEEAGTARTQVNITIGSGFASKQDHGETEYEVVVVPQ